MSKTSIIERSVFVRAQQSILECRDALSSETPVAIVYNGLSHAVLMASPIHLEELAIGFSLSEGIIEDMSQVYEACVEEVCEPAGFVVELRIAAQAFHGLKQRRRQLAGRTGCGLCGIDSLEAFKPMLPPTAPAALASPIAISAVEAALQTFGRDLPIRAATGSVHACAFYDRCGRQQFVFEDVGRHNALDKLIGHAARCRVNLGEGFLITSSRASYEMVLKAVMAQAICLTALSAPTAFAVELAHSAKLCLIGFAKPHRQVIYACPERLEGLHAPAP